MSCIVYPVPDTKTLPRSFDHNEDGEYDSPDKGQENFSHLRKYQHGDNISHISWKTTAKTGELFSKEFSGASPVTHWIEWDDILARDDEHRLSIMTSLIIDAENNNQHYGLKLPELKIEADCGDRHYHECLTALALY
ncbi:MAG TPA: DUF58 domain-containing protein [Gammaproteobacteria bacterium]|nr:DUF58 domain-containing protein [Gammaproteobacteria bacterium]